MGRLVMALGLVLMVWSSVATAATYVYFVPQELALGGEPAEVYVPVTFDAHAGLAGAALADAALKEATQVIGEAASKISTSIKGSAATVTIAEDAQERADVRDRALGAIYHTLRLSGVATVNVGGKALQPANFTRGVLMPVLDLAGALAPQKLNAGVVRVGRTLVDASEFYQRLAAGDAAIHSAALQLLSDGPTAVKLRLIEAIDSLRLPNRDGALTLRLQDPDVGVRLAVLDVFKNSRQLPVLKALQEVVERDQEADVKIAAVKILVGAGQTKYQRYLLLEKLKSDDSSVVLDAAQQLLKSGDAKFGSAFRGLAIHSNPDVRQVAVQGLVTFKQLDAMVKLLGDAQVNRDVGEPLADHLAQKSSGQKQALGINWLLENGSSAPAISAAVLAGEKRVAGTTAGLSKALKRSEGELRQAAGTALGKIRDTAGLEPLAGAIRDAGAADERENLSTAAIAIIAVQPLSQVIKISQSTDATIRELAIKSLAEFAKDRPNPRVLAVLKARLTDNEIGIRRASVFALARIKDAAIVKQLAGMKGDSDAGVRAQVAYALMRSRHPEADTILTQYLDDPDNAVKLQAVRAVRERKITAAFPKIRQLVEYRHDEIRRSVIEAILALAKPADPELFDLYQQRLYDTDAKVRVMAINGLNEYKLDPRTATTIGGAVTDRDESVKLHALTVLSASKDPNAVEQVIRGLFDESKKIQMATLDALETLKSEKAMRALQEYIKGVSDKEIRERAIQVLDLL